MATSQPIVFIVPGTEQPAGATTTRGAAAGSSEPALARGKLKHSVILGARRSGGGDVRVEAVPDEDVVVLEIANGPVLTLHPESARDLMLAQSGAKRARSAPGKDETVPGEVRVSGELQWRGLEEPVAAGRGGARGFLGSVLLSALKVVTGVSEEKAADWAASEVVKRVDAQVNTGVYALKPDALPELKDSSTPLNSVPAAPGGEPILILIHGTFSNTSGTFSKLWIEHPQRVRELFKQYGGRVYALDHPTLGASPIANALTLVQKLPEGAQLHVLTHSRGGLVAEVLARVCGDKGVDTTDLGFFKGDEYKAQRNALDELGRLVKRKAISVTRVVRVACPARGTLLASKRLDAYVSVFKWTLELAGLTVIPAIVDFLGAVAQHRADPEQIPGLAAQIPDNPLVKWLHAVDDPIAGELRVVAGDMEGDSVSTWLKTLLADAYYWTDNDLVVQTRSMYGGAPREAGASFVLDQGGKVSHFNYFSNERTVEAIVNALVQKQQPQGFNVIGPLSWSGKSSTGARGPGVADANSTAEREKPAVFVLPGILGSNLKVGDQRIWLGLRLINGLKRLAYKPGGADGVLPDGPIGTVYDDLVEFLATSHQVFEFAFDWRRPIEEEAKRLGADVKKALDARAKNGQPVRLVAHSMGGLVARTMQLECPDVWAAMMKNPGARLLMLGTPNAGSWAPMQVLSGDDTFGNALVAVGAPFQDYKARAMMATFPGFIQLQAALLDDGVKLGREQTWVDLAERDMRAIREYNFWHADERQLDVYRWGAPPQTVLDAAVKLRKRLDAQAQSGLGQFADKMLLVIGKSDFTPDGFKIDDQGLTYLEALEHGDGRVTMESALLPGVRTWKLDCEHGKLPDKESAFAAYLDLLKDGTTDKLPQYVAPAQRSGDATAAAPAPAHRLNRPSRMQSGRPPQNPREVLSPSASDAAVDVSTPGAALSVTVVNGNMKFINEPIMLGHYRALALTGAENPMDRLIGRMMSESLRLGQYPDQAGTHQVFINKGGDGPSSLQPPRPEAVIVVGLGEEGKLRATDLVDTVRLGVIAWSQRIVENRSTVPAQFELAATLIGSGGTGMSPGQSARLIAQGVREANERLAESAWPRVSHLRLIELYLDRATDAWRALQVLAEATPGFYNVTDTVQSGTGALRRSLDANYRGANYDFITAVTRWDQNGDTTISYTLDTKRARTEVRAQATQGPLLREIVAGASDDANTDAQVGRTLFELLVPVEMEPFLGGGGDIVIELDPTTAGIPWEVLDTPAGTRGGGDRRPWAIRSKLLRKLRTEDFRAQVVDANADANVLVIGEPACDEKIYPSLPGARAEANSVRDRLGAAGDGLQPDRIKALISGARRNSGPNARTVVSALLERDWRIVHIAGHGELPEKIGPEPKKRDDPPQRFGDPRGVVLSGGTFLGPREIRNMRVVPELVFVNCCHLGALDASGLVGRTAGERFDAPRFAAGVAEELIKIGVRCVIAAGWAVDDEAASAFAARFYDALLKGRRFIDAVALAREAAWQCGGNTWAAYQCYGDPEWQFRRNVGDAQRPTAPPPGEEFSGVASPPGLTLALENLTINARYQEVSADDLRAKIRYLEDHFAAQWGGMGAVAEAFGLAWAELDRERAIEWYQKAVSAGDGSATLSAREQLGNLRARAAWEAARRAMEAGPGTKQKGGAQHAGKRSRSPKIGGGRVGAPRKPPSAARGDELGNAIGQIGQLATMNPTTETLSILASAWKRKAMIDDAGGRPADAAHAITQMKMFYGRAENAARERNDPALFYPALNRMAAELIVDAGVPGWAGFDKEVVSEIRDVLAAKNRRDADFWSVIAVTELRLYEAIAKRDLVRELPTIRHEVDDLYERENALSKWSSVADQWQFVLPRYANRAASDEKKAAAELLKYVKLLAGRERPTGERSGIPARRRAGR